MEYEQNQVEKWGHSLSLIIVIWLLIIVFSLELGYWCLVIYFMCLDKMLIKGNKEATIKSGGE